MKKISVTIKTDLGQLVPGKNPKSPDNTKQQERSRSCIIIKKESQCHPDVEASAWRG